MTKQTLAKFTHDNKTIALIYKPEYEDYQVIFSGLFDNKPIDMSAGGQKQLAVNYFKSECINLLARIEK